jgi:hypothetical protein
MSSDLKYRYSIKRRGKAPVVGLMRNLSGLAHFHVEPGDEIIIKVESK